MSFQQNLKSVRGQTEPIENPTTDDRKKPRTRKANTWPKLGNAPLEELLKITDVPAEWDILIIGDGSAYPDSKNAGGYASFIIDRFGNRELLLGAGRFSAYQAELESLLQPLMWYHSNYGRLARTRLGRNVLNAVLYNDNEAVIAVGKKGGMPSSMELSTAPLWMSVVGLQQQGYCCTWNWIPREICSIHSLVDHASRASRLSLDVLVPGLQGLGLESINPVLSPGPVGK